MSKSVEIEKINKHKRAHTLFVSSPVCDSFVVVLKRTLYKLSLERFLKREREVPHVLYLGFFYPKLSHSFYQWHSLKKLKIRCCRSCCLIPVIKSVVNLNIQGWSQSRGLEVHVGTHTYQRSLRILELSLVIVDKFTKNMAIQFVNFYLMVNLLT